MISKDKMTDNIKWATRQRLQYIEITAYYTGLVTRSDVARAFGISDAAATKDLKLYGQLAPNNLTYRHNVFGFVPNEGFEPLFADLTPAGVLPMIAANLAATSGPYGDEPIYGISVDTHSCHPQPQQVAGELPLTFQQGKRAGTHSRTPLTGQYWFALACARLQ
jgi:hypothetical protein